MSSASSYPRKKWKAQRGKKRRRHKRDGKRRNFPGEPGQSFSTLPAWGLWVGVSYAPVSVCGTYWKKERRYDARIIRWCWWGVRLRLLAGGNTSSFPKKITDHTRRRSWRTNCIICGTIIRGTSCLRKDLFSSIGSIPLPGCWNKNCRKSTSSRRTTKYLNKASMQQNINYY